MVIINFNSLAVIRSRGNSMDVVQLHRSLGRRKNGGKNYALYIEPSPTFLATVDHLHHPSSKSIPKPAFLFSGCKSVYDATRQNTIARFVLTIYVVIMANYSKYFIALFYVFIRMMILLSEPKKTQLVNAAIDDENAVVLSNFCATSICPLKEPYNDVPKFICAPLAWRGYDIAFRQQNETVTIVLSGLYEMNWIGVAVSDNGKMLGSSAVVGWLQGKDSNSSVIKQYALEGKESNQVKPDKGNLKFGKTDPVMLLTNQTIYLAFQLKFDKPLVRQPFLFAAGAGKPGNDSILPKHIFRTAMIVDFSRGTFFLGNIDKNTERLNHGILAVTGWGIITPLGVAFARYLRDFEPTWYYLHSTVQFVGFIVGFAAIAVGKSLYDHTEPDFVYHKVIGYTVLALSVLQVCQFVVRPSSSSKVRDYWKMSHYWVGRLAILLAPVNVVIGLYLGGGDAKLRIAFLSVFGFLIGSIIFLEVRLQKTKTKTKTKKKRPPDTDSLDGASCFSH